MEQTLLALIDPISDSVVVVVEPGPEPGQPEPEPGQSPSRA